MIARLERAGGARVTALVAPAGYGKTTLARQWSERQTGPVAWYRATRASGDVALLAVQLDAALASVAPHLEWDPRKVSSIASVNPSPKPLAQAIVETFAPLTRAVLLVIDEWEAAASDEAEELVAMLVDGLDVRFLVTTRTRPYWFTPRMEVYGDGQEISMDELAMTDTEAAKVLAGLTAAAGRAGLMRSAGGWPAVLGLAAMSGGIGLSSSDLLSHALYEYLADELLATAAVPTQDALMLFAVAGVSDSAAARIALGASTDDAIADAVECGLLAVTERKSLSLHPLLRDVLLRRFGEASEETREALLRQCRNFFSARLWDEALCVTEAASDPAFAVDAIAAALDDLLATGRIATLQRWVAAARAAGAEGAIVDYAESESITRGGELDHALALATQAAGSLDGDLAARAHLVAGRAAHMTGRYPLAEQHADLAETLSGSARATEGALWLRFLAGIGKYAPDLRQRLEQFKAHAHPGVEQSLSAATGELTLARQGDGDFEQAVDQALYVLSLATESTDPLVHTSLLSTVCHCLILAGRYREALEYTDLLTRVADRNGIEFPILYAQIHRANALIGIRRFGQAARALDHLERQTRNDPGTYFPANVPLQRARLHASTGDLRRALDILSSLPSHPAGPTSGGELLGWRALLSAAAGHADQALALADEAPRRNNALQAKALALVARALVDVDADAQAATDRLSDAIESGVWDPLVIAVRAAPRFGAFIAEETEWRGWLQRLLSESADNSLARELGLQVPRAAKRKANLTPREAEVHELLAQGLTNEEIANLLHISVSTAKVHVKHIFEKLAVRSRAEAARALPADTTPAG